MFLQPYSSFSTIGSSVSGAFARKKNQFIQTVCHTTSFVYKRSAVRSMCRGVIDNIHVCPALVNQTSTVRSRVLAFLEFLLRCIRINLVFNSSYLLICKY